MPARQFEIFDPDFSHFAWDETKRTSNIGKHGIDFSDILPAFNNPMARMRSDRNDEIRYLVIGDANGWQIAIAYKEGAYKEEDGKVCRIISARKANRSERAQYRALYARGN
tara:strand:- start:823 stop:1155 length:333 start_codon:yes stop_codon:yes gene_type:complete